MTHVSGKWMLLLIAVGFYHCSGTSVDLPFDDDKEMNELTTSELKEVCTVGLEAFQDAYGEDICSLQGVMASVTSKGSCEEVRDACMNETFNPANCETPDETAPAECDVTVGELEACMNDTLGQIDDMPSFSCSTTMEELMEIQQDELNFSPSSSCDVINERCPELQMGMTNSSDDEMEGGSTSQPGL